MKTPFPIDIRVPRSARSCCVRLGGHGEMQRANNVLLVLLVCLALAQACSCWRSCGLNAYTKSPCRFPRRIGVELVLRGGEDELQHDDLSDMVEYGVEDFQDVIAALKQKLQSGVPSRHDFRNALCVCLSSASKGSATLSHAMELLRFMKVLQDCTSTKYMPLN